MKRLFATAAFFVAFARALVATPPCTAQQQTAQAPGGQCRIYFTVLELDPHLPGGGVAAMSKDQEKWWTKKGQEKYPSLCYDTSKANYKIVWWKRTVSRDNWFITDTTDPNYKMTVQHTRDFACAYVKQVDALEKDKPLFFVDAKQVGAPGKGTFCVDDKQSAKEKPLFCVDGNRREMKPAEVLENSLKFLSGTAEK